MKVPEAPIDLSRLKPEERELWNKYCATRPDGPVMAVWSFGYMCMLDLWGLPEVVTEYLQQHDPDDLIGQYQRSIRRAIAEGRKR